MDDAIHLLLQSLESVIAQSQTEQGRQFLAALAETEKLPPKNVSEQAATLVDCLDTVQKLFTPPETLLADEYFGFLHSKAINAAVTYEIPDLLADGPKPSDELAASSKTNPHKLCQVMDFLVGDGLFTKHTSEAGISSYANNTASTLLRKDHWTQWRNWADLFPTEFNKIADALPQSLSANETRATAQIAYNTDQNVFEYWRTSGLLPRFHKTLGGAAVAQLPGMLEDYPWDELCHDDICVMDLGGGGGHWIFSLLQAFPKMRGALFDLPEVIDIARNNFLTPSGPFYSASERMTKFLTGDFTKEVPPSSVYTIKWCLHDWPDEQAIGILRNIRNAIVCGPQSRLLVIESVLSDGRMSQPGRYGDLVMMTGANGKERTREGWCRVFEASGWKVHKFWRIRRAIPWIIEARPH